MLATKPLDIRPDHAEIIHRILKDNLEEVTYVFAFGSRANWTAKQSSDLDLAIDTFGVKLDKKIKSNLEDAFEESDLPYKVDVVDLNSVSESFREAIQDQLVRVLWDWRLIKLEDSAEIFSGGTPNTKMSEYWNGEFYWLASGETKNKFIYGTEKRITEEGIKKSSTRLAKCGSVVIAGAGQGYTRGQTSLLKIDTYINQSLICINSLDQSLLLNQWVFYNLSNRYLELRQISDSHSSRGSLTTAILKQLQLLCPPLPEQKRIAEILSSLDNKIEVNKQINHTLEEMAEALFKSWFIDFDPVRVKKAALEAGAGEKEANLAVMKFISSKTDEELEKFQNDYPEKYRELEDVAKLFSAEFQDSELGEIPLGWRVGKLEDLTIQLNSGGTPSTKEQSYYNGTINWFSTKELQDNFIFESEKKITDLGLTNSSAKLFPKNTVVMAIYASPTVGRLGILAKESTFNQAAVGLVAKNQVAYPFIYLLLKCLRDELNALTNGAAQQNLNVSLVKNFKIIIPDQEILKIFDKAIQPIFIKIRDNSEQIQALTRSRDELLPRLMRGELCR